MAFTNNVTRLLTNKGVAFSVHEYNYEAGVHSAVDVARAIGMPESRVFKTLVALPDEAQAKPVLTVIPGPANLDLKRLAKALGVKKARMASHADAESLTGLQTGGISPLALINRGFRIFVDASATDYETIAVSAGQRGANVELAPADLIRLTNGRTANLCEISASASP